MADLLAARGAAVHTPSERLEMSEVREYLAYRLPGLFECSSCGPPSRILVAPRLVFPQLHGTVFFGSAVTAGSLDLRFECALPQRTAYAAGGGLNQPQRQGSVAVRAFEAKSRHQR
jgi:hypothetical protein